MQHADFWGPASNFGIPIAAIADIRKDPEMYADFFISQFRPESSATGLAPAHIPTFNVSASAKNLLTESY